MYKTKRGNLEKTPDSYLVLVLRDEQMLQKSTKAKQREEI